jgi:hypothetical protein
VPAEDDPETVPNSATVLRAVADLHFTVDEDGTRRLQSTAFNPSSDGSGTSVVIAELMGSTPAGDARQPRDILDAFPNDEVWWLTGGETREAGVTAGGHALGLKPDPTPEEPGHANITWPPELTRSKAHKVRRRLADLARQLAPEDSGQSAGAS